jgi:hypothetical protein
MADILEQLQSLFWDTDVSKLSVETDWKYIIQRVVERGSCSDIRAVWQLYGPARIRDTLLHVRCLDKKNISFFANLFDLNPADFRASRTNKTGCWNT